MKIPPTMRAVRIDAPGAPEELYIGEASVPTVGPRDVLVRVRATALNRADLMQRSGAYPPPPGASPILGLEAAGEVVSVGAEVEGWAPGDAAMALLPGGGYAEYVSVPAPLLMPLPAGFSFEEAAALPEVFLTAYQALFWLAALEEGETVLIHAGASGVGTAAIQLARLAEAVPIVTASAPKHAVCLDLGAARAIDYRADPFELVVQEATEGAGADVILDFIGAPYLPANIEALATDGRLVMLALMGGRRAEGFDLGRLFRKRGSLITSTLRNRPAGYKARLSRDFLHFAQAALEDGRLRPVIDQVYDWQEVAEAHRRMESNANVGKLVLRVP